LVTLDWLKNLVKIENPSCLSLEVHPQADHGSKIYTESQCLSTVIRYWRFDTALYKEVDPVH